MAAQPDMEQLAQALIQPLPLGRSTALLNHAVQASMQLTLSIKTTARRLHRHLLAV